MANSTAYGNGRATATSHRLGRLLVRRRVQLDREEWGLSYDSDETHPAIRAHLKVALEEGWEVAQYERVRSQHYITMTKWVTTDAVEPAGDGGGAPGA
jgi:hypothetical protein